MPGWREIAVALAIVALGCGLAWATRVHYLNQPAVRIVVVPGPASGCVAVSAGKR